MNSYQEKNDPIGNSEFQKNLVILREVSFFSEFPLEVLKVFAYLCTRETYKADEIIFNQDDDDGRAYYILSGETRLSRRHKNEEIFIRTCLEKTFFGALTLASMVNRPFSMTAVSETNCLVLTRKMFNDVMEQFPESRKNIIKGLVENIIAWEVKFINENIDCELCRGEIGVSLI